MDPKEDLRRTLRAARRRWMPERAAASRALFEHVRAQPWWSAAESLAAFVGTAEEVDTTPLLEGAWAAGKRVWLPRVASRHARTLAWVRVDDPAALVPGAFGLLEPRPDGRPGTLAEVDVVFVPGLAFDRRGGRLGMGGGFYDRALEPWRETERPLRVGLCATPFVMAEELPAALHDVPMHWLVTERGGEPCGRG